MDGPLVRTQVVENRRKRLYGDVVIADTRISSVSVAALGASSLALVIWAVTAEYPRTTQVVGTVTTTRASAKVFGARPGVIEAIFVKEGQPVRRGQPLAFVGVDVRDNASHGAATDTLAALDRQSEAIGAQADAQRRVRDAERLRLAQAIDANDDEQHSIRRQISIQGNIVQASSASLNRIMPVVEKGFISQFEVDRRRQALLLQQQQVEQLRQQSAQLDAKREELLAQLRMLPVDYDKRLAELHGQEQGISEQRSRAKVEVGYTIIAPVEGKVTALQSGPGRAVDPRIPLMAVVPQAAEFQADLFAPSSAAGFIRPGQRVRIMYDAFPYKQFGSFGGHVVEMSSTAFAPTELDTPIKVEETVYRVRVRLDRQSVPASGRSLPLQSGMTLSATVVLERRSFLDWLLQPLNAVRNRT